MGITAKSRPVRSNQTGIHEDLFNILQKHREKPYLKPVSRHTREAFEYARQRLASISAPLILDSGCGTGESTLALAERHPDAFVLGVDKSLARLQKNPLFATEHDRNLLLLRADLFDFWRLAAREGWRFERHYIFYPNPWPKKRHLKRRIHGHPAFFDMLRLSPFIELRSNWRIYLEEFAAAVAFVAGRSFEVETFVPDTPISAFERKYWLSGHELYRLRIWLE